MRKRPPVDLYLSARIDFDAIGHVARLREITQEITEEYPWLPFADNLQLATAGIERQLVITTGCHVLSRVDE